MTDRERARFALGDVYLPPAAYEAKVAAIEAAFAAVRVQERARLAKESAALSEAQLRAAMIRGGM